MITAGIGIDLGPLSKKKLSNLKLILTMKRQSL